MIRRSGLRDPVSLVGVCMGKRYEDWKPGDTVVNLKYGANYSKIKKYQRLTITEIFKSTPNIYIASN